MQPTAQKCDKCGEAFTGGDAIVFPSLCPKCERSKTMTDIDLEEARELFVLIGSSVTPFAIKKQRFGRINKAGLDLITEVEGLRKELTGFYKQDNQEHRLIAKIERLEGERDTLKEEVERLRWWKEHGQKLRNAIAEMDKSATTDQKIEKAPLKMKDELKGLRELVRESAGVLEQFRPTIELLLRRKPVRNLDEILLACDKLRTKIAEIEKEMG